MGKQLKQADETISWGIIGAGDVCEKKSGPALYKAPGSKLVAITKRKPEAAKDFAARHNVERWYTDPAELIADDEVDVVYVATPPHLHRKYAEQAMRAGKAVLVEKPMATNIADCDAMIELSAETGLPLWVAYYRRALDKFVAIRSTLTSGVIGEPGSITVELSQNRSRYAGTGSNEPWRVDPATAGGGIVADMGSHMLDLVDWFFGPISVGSAMAVNRAGDYRAEDVVTASFIAGTATTGGFVTGSALWDFSGRRESDRTVIRGSEGSIEYSTFDDRPALLTASDGTTTEMERHPFPPHVHQPLVELINAEIRGGAPSPSTATSGARTNRVLDALVSGYYAAGR